MNERKEEKYILKFRLVLRVDIEYQAKKCLKMVLKMTKLIHRFLKKKSLIYNIDQKYRHEMTMSRNYVLTISLSLHSAYP